MSVIVVFILVVLGVAGWWLAHQRILSKPWLEVGADTPLDAVEPVPTAKMALVVFLAVVGCLFALFASAYFMRMAVPDWRPMPLPSLIWVNTGLLVLSSVELQCAVIAARRGELATVRLGLFTGGLAAVAFLAGQLLAWRELVAGGYPLGANPSSAFFYLLTGAHGLHILGGLVALGRTAGGAWGGESRDRLRLNVELCATYWHFLLFVWIGIVVLLAGWANAFIQICRQVLT